MKIIIFLKCNLKKIILYIEAGGSATTRNILNIVLIGGDEVSGDLSREWGSTYATLLATGLKYE